MKCQHVQQKMLDYTEHTLDVNTHDQIEEHLQQCSTCARELLAFQQTLDILASSPIQEPPESFWTDFTHDVMRKIRNAEPPVPATRIFTAWRMRLAIACMLLLVGIAGLYAYWSFRHQSPHLTTQTSEHPETAESLETALQRIVPEEIAQDMLETEFALLEQMTVPALEIHSNEVTLTGLISSLSDEEKRALLLELYKLREHSQ